MVERSLPERAHCCDQHRVPLILARDYDAFVDWRTRLRKIVNREDHLDPVRLGILRIIDPIEWYMRKSDEEPRRPSHHPPGG